MNGVSIPELFDVKYAKQFAGHEAAGQYGGLDEKNQPLPDGAWGNSDGNRYLHCLAACMLGVLESKRYGTKGDAGLLQAKKWLDAHESEDQKSEKADTRENSNLDLVANGHGLSCARLIVGSNGVKGTISENQSDEQKCIECCRKKVRAPSRGLWLVIPGGRKRPDGDGAYFVPSQPHGMVVISA